MEVQQVRKTLNDKFDYDNMAKVVANWVHFFGERLDVDIEEIALQLGNDDKLKKEEKDALIDMLQKLTTLRLVSNDVAKFGVHEKNYGKGYDIL